MIKNLDVTCSKCKCHINELRRKDVFSRETGYKGKINFYTHCKKCKEEVIIPASQLSQSMKTILILRDNL